MVRRPVGQSVVFIETDPRGRVHLVNKSRHSMAHYKVRRTVKYSTPLGVEKGCAPYNTAISPVATTCIVSLLCCEFWYHIVYSVLQLTKCQCQVINLGAGFDTVYWNLKDAGLAPQNFIEVDFPGVTTRKCHYIKTCKPLLEKISSEGEQLNVKHKA